MRKIIIFGCGRLSAQFVKYKDAYSYVFKDDEYIFTDNNKVLWNNDFYGYKVISPDDISSIQYDKIIIASEIYENEILNQLEHLRVPQDKMETLEQYKCEMMTQKAYEKLYKNKQTINSIKNDNIVVYTSITGGYDELKEPEYVGEGITYVCFTNNKSLKSKVWNIEYIHNENMDNLRLAKSFKVNPHRYFKEFETSVWVDGKFKILGDMRTYIEQYGRNKSMLLFPHYERDCIYREAAVCVAGYIADINKIVEQVTDYYNEGYPFNNGLYECGCIVRCHNDGKIINLMNEWEKQQNRYSIRDQLSMPYICWKSNYIPDISDVYINNNRWLKFYPHKK